MIPQTKSTAACVTGACVVRLASFNVGKRERQVPRGLIAGGFLAAFVAVLTVPGQAQEPAPPPPLTTIAVESFIASYPGVKAKAAELREEYQQEYTVAEEMSQARAWYAWTRIGGAGEQLDELVDEHGFDDFSAWIRTFSRVGQAYAFARDDGAMDTKLAETLARLEKDENLPEWQKEMIRQQLLHSAEAVAAMRPAQENIDAVKPYVDQLDGIFDSER